MKFTVVLLLVMTIVRARSNFHRFTQPELDAQFEQFKFTNNRNYATAEEESLRKDIFASNLDLILQHNSQAQLGLHSYILGVNRFADLTKAEIHKQMLNSVTFNQTTNSVLIVDHHKLDNLPDSVDWTQKGVVTPIKDQGQGASVVAFGSVASIESAWAIKTGKLISLAEGQIADCCGGSKSGNAMSDDDAFKCIIKMGGIDDENSYPYPSTKCGFDPKNIAATISSYVDIKRGCEDCLQAAVALNGPVSVEIDASQLSFIFYDSGVYDEPACSAIDLNYGLAVVGYGAESGTQFWKVKNSWGTNWGEQGYIRMSRNKNDQCGIATQASYPVV